MKNLVCIFVLVTSLSIYSQEVKTTRTGGYFYCECSDGFTSQARSTFTLASGDGQNYAIRNKGVTCVVKSPDHTITASGFEKKVFEPVKVEIDTIIRGKYLPYKRNSNRWFRMKLLYHKWGDYKYFVRGKEHGEQPAHYVADSVYYNDTKKIIHKYFFSKKWEFSKREGIDLEDLQSKQFTDFGDIPGKTMLKNDTVYRHTHTFTKRVYQVCARDMKYGTIDTLAIQVNWKYKE